MYPPAYNRIHFPVVLSLPVVAARRSTLRRCPLSRPARLTTLLNLAGGLALLTVIGGWYFATWEYPEVAALITQQALPIESMITHRFSLDEAPEAFRMFHARETEKAVFHP